MLADRLRGSRGLLEENKNLQAELQKWAKALENPEYTRKMLKKLLKTLKDCGQKSRVC